MRMEFSISLMRMAWVISGKADRRIERVAGGGHA